MSARPNLTLLHYKNIVFTFLYIYSDQTSYLISSFFVSIQSTYAFATPTLVFSMDVAVVALER
jgi:hypothetical protein